MHQSKANYHNLLYRLQSEILTSSWLLFLSIFYITIQGTVNIILLKKF